LLVLTLAFNGLSAGERAGGGLFLSNQANLSAEFYLSVTPAGWTFSIWGVIYTLQVLWVILSIAAIFKRGPEGFLYLSPSVLPASIFMSYCSANVMNIAWLFAFDRKVLELALVCLFAIAVSAWTTVALSFWAFETHRARMEKEFHRIWTIAFRVALQNGVAMYATWTSIATLLNLAHVMTYSGGVKETASSTTVLSLLLIELIVFAALDFALLDRFFRYLLTPYITFIVALIGSLTNGQMDQNGQKYPKTQINQNFTIALLVIASLLFVIKMLSWIKKPFSSNRA